MMIQQHGISLATFLSRNIAKQENHESYYPRYIGAIRYVDWLHTNYHFTITNTFPRSYLWLSIC